MAPTKGEGGADSSQHIGEDRILLEVLVEELKLSVQLLICVAHEHGWACWVCFHLKVHHLCVALPSVV